MLSTDYPLMIVSGHTFIKNNTMTVTEKADISLMCKLPVGIGNGNISWIQGHKNYMKASMSMIAIIHSRQLVIRMARQ